MMTETELKELLVFGGLFAGINEETTKKKVAFIYKAIKASIPQEKITGDDKTTIKLTIDEGKFPKLPPEYAPPQSMPAAPLKPWPGNPTNPELSPF